MKSPLAWPTKVSSSDARAVLRTLTPKEIEVQRKDGRWYVMRILPYRTVQNAIGGLVLSFLDIDKQKQAASALEEANRRLSEAIGQMRLSAAVVANSNDAITTLDADGKILTWNRGAEQMYGYSQDEAVGMTIASLVPEAFRAQARKRVEDIRAGKEPQSLESKRITRDGRVLDVWVTVTRLTGEPGSRVAFATIERDITERNRLDRTKDEFIGMVSHELRTPLTVVTSAVQTVQDERLSDDDQKELLREATLGAKTLSAILDNLLELSRHQAGRLELIRKPAQLPAVIESAARRVRQSHPAANIAVEVGHELPQASVDVARLEQVVYNLIENAVKYSPDGSLVRVFARQENSRELLVGVSDKGPGIAPEDQPKIFEAFIRFATSKQGLGLGLTVSKRLVEAHGGRIWVDSKPGQGSTFYFTVPLK